MANPTVIATVIGHEADGATILHIPGGTLKTYLPQTLPAGTSLHVDIESPLTSHPTTALSPLSDEASATASLLHEWEALKETVTWAQQAESPIAKALLNTLPQVNDKLTSGLLFFIAAMKGGDVTQWLGQNLTRALDFKVPELAKRLKADATQLQQMLVEGGPNNWSSSTLPMVFQGQLEHARLFYRQDDTPDDQENQGKGGGHRFIIEVGLSHLGDMQFDGFVRQGKKNRVFDLVIRSDRPLPPAMHNSIRTLFDDALKTTGYLGYLTFQQGNHSFVRPMAALKPTSSDSNTILA
jgi:hypothetical protein